ncbi:hypothetical protein ACF061_14200 [Streptomyces sp. NPDC015220]|uniref:hypothetical protein n=1 Tax=Streptomyces sp. NPDC015220 TaxID=3364947 RepID=UPI003701D100
MSQSPSFPSPPPFPSRTPSSFPSALPPAPAPYPPGADAPATCEVPHFAPVRVRGGRHRWHRLVRHRRRAVAAGLAVTAAALVAAGPRHAADPPRGGPARAHPVPAADTPPDDTPLLDAPSHDVPPGPAGSRGAGAPRTVTAPVRIADAATVRLLRPGDRVDVIAAADPATGGAARVLARGARVAKVPPPAADPGDGQAGDGALIALTVPITTAARLAGVSSTTRLAVILW